MNDLSASLAGSDERADLDRLHARLVQDASRDGVADVTYRTTDSPYGPLLLAATERGLVMLAYSVQDHERVLDRLASTVSPRLLAGGPRLDPVVRQLAEYFDRRRQAFDVPLDLRLSAGFRRAVLDHLVALPYGSTETYGTVAAATGHPRASRAVGTACATNPIPIVVPCHRILRADGSLGGYLGGVAGLAVKQSLLDLEHPIPTGTGPR